MKDVCRRLLSCPSRRRMRRFWSPRKISKKLMVEWEASDPEIGTAIRCPQCKSPRVEYPQLTRKFLTPWLASILFALKIFPKEFYCQDCHFTWGKDGDPLPQPAAWETFS